MDARGYFTMLHWHGAPIRVHKATLMGAALIGGVQWAPGLWASLALVVMAHDLGRAGVARSVKHRIVETEEPGLGILCTLISGQTIPPLFRGMALWAGVLAQLLLLSTAIAVETVFPPTTAFGRDLGDGLTLLNGATIALTLLPIGRLNGEEAWRIIPALLAPKESRACLLPARPRFQRHPVSGALTLATSLNEQLERLRRKARLRRTQDRLARRSESNKDL